MAHNTSHRRILADPDPPTDPTRRKPKAHAAKNHHSPPRRQLIHPLSDPAVATPPSLSTIQNISHRFSRLYANHKKQVSSHSSNPDPHFQTRKDPSFPALPDSSCTVGGGALFKSSSMKERNKTMGRIEKKYNSGDDFKKPPCAEKIPSEKGRSSVSGGGRRRSFCSSQVELSDFLSSSGVKVVAVDMPPFMQVHAVGCARKAHDSLEKFTSKSLAYTLKKEFDGVYGPAWHCIVGTGFGSFVTHSVGGFMYFSMDHKLYILLFKTTVQRAE